ncbi:MAG: GH3 auxin-responsive promoter family protein [Myxococcota bacterium]
MVEHREASAFLEGLRSPEQVEEETLFQSIIRPNEGSAFGQEHGFSKIRSIADYRAAVPIRDYEGFRARIDRIVEHGEQGILTTEPVKRFFATSGSTAKPKYIPVTASFAQRKSKAFGIYWALCLEQHPGVSRAGIVTNFSDSGEAKKTPGGLPVSSESAYWAMMTAATQRRDKPIIPRAVAKIAGTDARYYAIARILVEERFSGLMTLNPSTLWLLFQKMNEFKEELFQDVEQGGLSARFDVAPEARRAVEETYRGNPARAAALRAVLNAEEPQLRAHAVWPELKLSVSWRSPMLAPYLKLLEPHLFGVKSRDYLSMASEGVISIPVEPEKSGGVVASSIHFLEFVPEAEIERPNPTALSPHQLEVGKSYVTILSTQSGLYRYNIGDVVRVSRFVDRTPVIEFMNRAGNTCSLTGEKLTEDQVTGALMDAAERTGLKIDNFTVAPAPEGFPRYVVAIELSGKPSPETLRALLGGFEAALSARNIEYASKRESQRLGAPELWRVKTGEYANRRQRKIEGGTNDAQFKPTHLTRDSKVLGELVVEERVLAP